MQQATVHVELAFERLRVRHRFSFHSEKYTPQDLCDMIRKKFKNTEITKLKAEDDPYISIQSTNKLQAGVYYIKGTFKQKPVRFLNMKQFGFQFGHKTKRPRRKSPLDIIPEVSEHSDSYQPKKRLF